MKIDESRQIVSKLVFYLKKIRKEQGISHEKLAERSGVSRQAISKIESGERIPSILTCLKLAKGLDKSLQQLLDLAGGKDSNK